jgi:hypothetical protein
MHICHRSSTLDVGIRPWGVRIDKRIQQMGFCSASISMAL